MGSSVASGVEGTPFPLASGETGPLPGVAGTRGGQKMQIMRDDSWITIKAQGEDAEEAVDALSALVECGFNEND